MVIPEIALEPDISGVCSVGGTLVIRANPINTASTEAQKTYQTNMEKIISKLRSLIKAITNYMGIELKYKKQITIK